MASHWVRQWRMEREWMLRCVEERRRERGRV